MAIVLTVVATPRTPIAESVTIEASANERDIMRCRILSRDASYRPVLDQDCTLVDGATTLFGGLIQGLREHGMTDEPTAGIVTDIDFVDYNKLAEERVVTADFPSQSVEDRLTAIVDDYLNDAGVTLSPSQATGPTLEAATYRLTRASDILEEICRLAGGWVRNIDEGKVLRAWAPGDIAAPFNITTPPAGNWYGDLTVEPTRQDYANRVFVDTGSYIATAQDAAAQSSLGRIVELAFTAPDTTTDQQADALAVAYLAQLLPTLKRVTYSTLLAGLAPGQTQTINVPARNINNTFLITDVATRWDSKRWHRRVTAIEGLVYQNGWRDTFRQWGIGGNSSAGAVFGGGSGVSRPPFFLGPTGIEFVQSPTPDWVPASAIQQQISSVARGTTAANVTVRLRALNSGVSVQARLYDLSTLASVGASSVVTNTAWETVTFAVTLDAASHFYELQLLPSATNEDVGAAGAVLL